MEEVLFLEALDLMMILEEKLLKKQLISWLNLPIKVMPWKKLIKK
jgi:hypothetical protein